MRVRAYIRNAVPEKIARRVVRKITECVPHASATSLMSSIDQKANLIVVELADSEVRAIISSGENRVMKLRKVTPEVLAAIKDLLDQGMRMKVVEERFGVSRQTIYNHLRRPKT